MLSNLSECTVVPSEPTAPKQGETNESAMEEARSEERSKGGMSNTQMRSRACSASTFGRIGSIMATLTVVLALGGADASQAAVSNVDISKTADRTSVIAGDRIGFTLTVTNHSSTPLRT
jgi:hypothetical protein